MIFSYENKKEWNKTFEVVWSAVDKIFNPVPDSNGIIEYRGRRLIWLVKDVFFSIRKVIEEKFHGFGRKVLYDSGYIGGLKIAKMFEEFKKEVGFVEKLKLIFSVGLNNALKLSANDKYSIYYKIGGYGRYAGWLSYLDIVEEEEGKYTVVDIYDSFEASLYSKKQKEPVCHFFRGILAGIAEHSEKRRVKEVVEEKCKAMEDECCRFRIIFEET